MLMQPTATCDSDFAERCLPAVTCLVILTDVRCRPAVPYYIPQDRCVDTGRLVHSPRACQPYCAAGPVVAAELGRSLSCAELVSRLRAR